MKKSQPSALKTPSNSTNAKRSRAMTTTTGTADIAWPFTHSSTSWDDVAKDLEEQGGMAVVALPCKSGEIHAHAFQVARRVLQAWVLFHY
jgi:hypothetical protein